MRFLVPPTCHPFFNHLSEDATQSLHCPPLPSTAQQDMPLRAHPGFALCLCEKSVTSNCPGLNGACPVSCSPRGWFPVSEHLLLPACRSGFLWDVGGTSVAPRGSSQV